MEIKLFNPIVFFLSTMLFMTTVSFSQDKVVALHPAGAEFNEAFEAIKQDLEGELILVSKEINPKQKWSNLREDILKEEPVALVIMDNHALNLYKEHVSNALKNNVKPYPAVALMALQLPNITQGMDIMGVSYEIPAVTSVVNLRAVSKKPIKKVGVLYRNSWESFFKQNQGFCKTEQVDLIGVSIDDKSRNISRDINNGLRELINRKKVDALWVVNDNALLNNNTIAKNWIPATKRAKIPVIVGVETLVQTKFELGSFAVLPDHSGLGSQVANLLFELMDNDWSIDETQIDQPLSVVKIINTTLAKKKSFLNESGLSNMDKEIR